MVVHMSDIPDIFWFVSQNDSLYIGMVGHITCQTDIYRAVDKRKMAAHVRRLASHMRGFLACLLHDLVLLRPVGMSHLLSVPYALPWAPYLGLVLVA